MSEPKKLWEMTVAERRTRFLAGAKALEEGFRAAMDMVCGNCEFFSDEDAAGLGWCNFEDGYKRCDRSCKHWTERDR